MKEIFLQIDVRSGSFGTQPGIRSHIKPQIGQKALQCPGLPQAKYKPDADLWDENCGFTRENKLGSCEAESCAVVEVEGTLLLCRIERDVKRFVDLAALDLALHIFFSSPWSSVRSWCLYSRPVFHPYWDLSASKINFWRSWSSSIPLSKAWLVFSTYRSFGRQSGRLQWHL